MTCARLVLLPQPSFAVQVRVMILVQPTVLVTVVTPTLTLAWQASTNVGALKLGAVGHSIVPSGPLLTVTAGAVVSIPVFPSRRSSDLPQPSLAVQVRVMILVQPTVLVTVVTLPITAAGQASSLVGTRMLFAVGHSIVPSGP